MKDDFKYSKDVDSDNDNDDINNYFDMDCDKSFSSYGNNDIDSKCSYNAEEFIGENNNNKNKTNQIDDYIKYNLRLPNNSNINEINNNYNSSFINSNIIINSNDKIRVNITKKGNINSNYSSINNQNNNNINYNKGKNRSNIINICSDPNIINNGKYSDNINIRNYDNNLNKKNEEENNSLYFPSISKNINKINNNNKNDINNDGNNYNNIRTSNEDNIIANENLSSSSNDVKIITNEEFRKHFQEDKYGPQRKIEVIETKNNTNIRFSEYHDIMKHKKNNIDLNEGIKSFFLEEKNNNKNNNLNPNNNNIKYSNKNMNQQQKKINFNSQNKEKDNRLMKKRKRFSPLPKDQYRDNKSFQKLLFNRLEKQILTDIYDEYENKEEFEETYYYLDNIKNILCQKGVEEAINYLNNIEPMSLREKIIIESTFFIKQIVKEEINFAENNEGKLIVYKQPDFLFSQNTKHSTPLSGRVHKNFRPNKRSKKFKFTRRHSYNEKNEYGNEEYYNNKYYSNNFNKNPFMYKSHNIQKKHK